MINLIIIIVKSPSERLANFKSLAGNVDEY